ncbi:RidA family protein [Variovorax sp. dw_308]|uniref:RidA family protein n=1 Tax=Variovorax sp. dw_308 TaxID=2721546 RepID=UPI001C497496|nr:RidA family protein [Variovorax sp. dw_308]
MNIQRFKVGQRLSKIAVHAGVAYLSGQVPQDPSMDIEGQTRSVLQQIDNLLAEAGSDKSRILQCQIFLANIKDIDAMNIVWDAWVAADNAPPRATVEAKLGNPAWKIEIVLTAALS